MSRHRSEPPADWLPSSDEGTEYPAMPGYPDYPPADGSPAISHDEYGPDHMGYGVVPDYDSVDQHGPAPDEYGVVYDGYGLVPEPATARLRRVDAPGDAAPEAAGPGLAPRTGGSAARWAMLGYLTVPLFGFVVPLLVYLRALHGSSWSRQHAAQALNVWITVVLYDLSAAIMGAMLALDSPQVALIVFGPLVVGLWLVMLGFLVRAATAASQGLAYTVPRWLCSPIVH